jgi:hypothetical protein
VIAAPAPVYIDLLANRTVGRVNAIIIEDTKCHECTNLSMLIEFMKGTGISIANTTVLNLSEKNATELISKYNITKIPAGIFSADISAYDAIRQAWSNLGTIEADGTYILREINPPYRNLSDNRTLGLVAMVNILDLSCTECYNASINRLILESGGVFIANETTYATNSSAGKLLLDKYNITLVPMFLLSPDASAYASLSRIWQGIGTVEKDGWYVFRNPAALKGMKYKNLSSGQVVG